MVTSDADAELGFSGRRLRLILSYILFAAGLVGGVALGIEHHREGMRVLFVFRETEPLSAWVVVGSLLGTLPATVLALVSPRVAAFVLWLLATALLVAGALSFLPLDEYEDRVLAALSALINGPGAQALVGTVLWFSRRPGQSD
jgi:hypothetical protein